MPTIRAVAFDVFGTLCQITEPRAPFKQLLSQCPAATEWRRTLMCQDMRITDLANELPISPSPAELAALENDLQIELASIALYPEVLATLKELNQQGIKLALISNLATSYADPVRRLIAGQIETQIWSFEVGHIKPEREIFEILVRRLDCQPSQILMVGDSLVSDIGGARKAGLNAILLDRTNRYTSGESIPDISAVIPLIERHGCC
ncbi:HAD family hydrolase [Eoetvoesiella caeni]